MEKGTLRGKTEGKSERREVQVTERKESCQRGKAESGGWSHLISQHRKVIIDVFIAFQ